MSVFSKLRVSFFVFLFALPLFLNALTDVTIIDFGQYESRIAEEFTSMNEDTPPNKPDGSPNLILTPDSMYMSNWIVELRSSGIRVPNIVKSQCVPAESKEHGQTVMGVRINFPGTRQNDRAYIYPPFPIHAYNKDGNFTNLSNGIVANVGDIKDVSVWVKGRNYPFDLAVRLTDRDNITHEYFFGHLFFDNWRKLTWINPNYLEFMKNRVLERQPMYPRDIPYYRFSSFVVYREMSQIGGDFILYIKNLTMSHDLFTATMIDEDIDDEAVWKILKQRALENREREHSALAEKAYDLEMDRIRTGEIKGAGE
jgi:hypothetical protein